MKINMQIEPIELKSDAKNEFELVKLPVLSKTEQDVLDPSVPPTSGIRMEIFQKKGDLYVMSAKAQAQFLRVFKAVGDIAKKELEKDHPNALIVADDRPSAKILTEYCAKVFSANGYQIIFQSPTDAKSKVNAADDPFYSRMGTPYASASSVLFDNIDVVIQLTASHNPIIWNGVKFYIQLPIPISGRVMKAVSKRSLELTEIALSKKISPKLIDADGKNNEYILKLIKNVIDVSILKGKKIIFWPYLGHAPEIQDLLNRAGVDLIAIDQEIEPPNPTAFLDEKKIQDLMMKNDVKITILMDADRDRVVFVLRNAKTNKFVTLTPNELYTAMHNLLSTKFNKKIINVRTVPSDPRGDNTALVNIIAGVGYKHLGMVLYSALGEDIDPAKFSSGIFYGLRSDGYKRFMSQNEIKQEILAKCNEGDNLAMVMWEESGGHTFNILENKGGQLKSALPVIGDKYPAPAILILCALIEMGYDLTESVDRNIIGDRSTIDADDSKKIKVVQHFAKMKGESFQVGAYSYQIDTLQQVDDVVDIIVLRSKTTVLYFRPSGTGPEVRVYVFGPAKTAQEELKLVMARINEMFPKEK